MRGFGLRLKRSLALYRLVLEALLVSKRIVFVGLKE